MFAAAPSSKVMTSRLWLSHAVVEVSFLTKPGSQVSMAATPLG